MNYKIPKEVKTINKKRKKKKEKQLLEKLFLFRFPRILPQIYEICSQSLCINLGRSPVLSSLPYFSLHTPGNAVKCPLSTKEDSLSKEIFCIKSAVIFFLMFELCAWERLLKIKLLWIGSKIRSLKVYVRNTAYTYLYSSVTSGITLYWKPLIRNCENFIQ